MEVDTLWNREEFLDSCSGQDSCSCDWFLDHSDMMLRSQFAIQADLYMDFFSRWPCPHTWGHLAGCPHSGSLRVDWPQQAASERYLYGRPALPHYPASLAKLIASQKITTVFGKAVSLVKDYEGCFQVGASVRSHLLRVEYQFLSLKCATLLVSSLDDKILKPS